MAPALNSVRNEVGEDDELIRLLFALGPPSAEQIDMSSSTRMSCPEALALLASIPGGLILPESCPVLVLVLCAL